MVSLRHGIGCQCVYGPSCSVSHTSFKREERLQHKWCADFNSLFHFMFMFSCYERIAAPFGKRTNPQGQKYTILMN